MFWLWAPEKAAEDWSPDYTRSGWLGRVVQLYLGGLPVPGLAVT